MWHMTATELLKGYASLDFSPTDAIKSILVRCEEMNSQLNALYDIQVEKALEEAEASAIRWRNHKPKGALDGVPIVIKDSIDVAGMRMFRGLKAHYDIGPSQIDSPPVARLREAGAIVFAKSTMPDMGFLGAGISSFHGVTHNPWGHNLNTGGSSSGAGAAVASGMAPLAVGSDVGGSVRLPASHCGLVGLKPTAGVIPHLPYSRDRVAGPITRSVEDAVLLLSILSQPDSNAFEPGANLASKVIPKDMKGTRIGLLTSIGCGPELEPEVESLIRQAATAFNELGAQITEIQSPIDFDFLESLTSYFSLKASMELDTLPEERHDWTLDIVKIRCAAVQDMSAKEYVIHTSRLDKAQRLYRQAVEKFDYVLSPIMPMANFPATAVGANPEAPHQHVGFAALANQAGLPAATINCGFVGTSPVGLQLIAPHGRDLDLLQACMSYSLSRQNGYRFPESVDASEKIS